MIQYMRTEIKIVGKRENLLTYLIAASAIMFTTPVSFFVMLWYNDLSKWTIFILFTALWIVNVTTILGSFQLFLGVVQKLTQKKDGEVEK